MRRASAILASFLLLAPALAGEDVTVPAVASFVGATPFYSDVRVFNPSYSATVSVTATYRCFLGVGATCPATAPVTNFPLAPRESRAFNDMIAVTFNTPNTAGGVEFESSGAEDDIIVTSRLFSIVPVPTVGMFVPGLRNDAANTTSVLTSIRNGGEGQGFRCNVGVFNREDQPVTVTFRVFQGGAQAGQAVERAVGAHSGVQVNRIFTEAGVPNLQTDNAVVVVTSTGEVFSYGAVIDNATTDPVFIVGAEDRPFQAAPSPTPTPPAASVRRVFVGQGGDRFVDEVSGTGTTSIAAGTTVMWIWSGSVEHTCTSGTCQGGGGYYSASAAAQCDPNGLWNSSLHMGPYTYERVFNTVGAFPYYCSVHEDTMTGRVNVTAPAAASAKRGQR